MPCHCDARSMSAAHSPRRRGPGMPACRRYRASCAGRSRGPAPRSSACLRAARAACVTSRRGGLLTTAAPSLSRSLLLSPPSLSLSPPLSSSSPLSPPTRAPAPGRPGGRWRERHRAVPIADDGDLEVEGLAPGSSTILPLRCMYSSYIFPD